MLNLGCILISDLVVTNMFMHSLPGMILLYLATPFYTKGVFARDIITFARFMHCYRSTIIDSHIATLAEVDQKIHQSVHFLPLTVQLPLIFSNIKQEMHYTVFNINSKSLVNVNVYKNPPCLHNLHSATQLCNSYINL